MNLKKFKNIKEKSPYVIILVGPPLSGKSSFCNEFKKINEDVIIISRDEIIMDVFGSRDYTTAYNNVDRKKVNKILNEKIQNASIENRNVIIDMTNMTSKIRKSNLNYFSNNYYKICVIFPILPDEEYINRNKKRSQEENKNISMDVVKNMIASYQPISKNEGFDKIVSV
jgi:tRNA uridine 5-carbamoylmethylation protein Kti12